MFLSDGTLSFLALGDWGGQSFLPYTTPDEVACANQMGALAKRINSSFVLALGDNFYSFGIPTDAHDKRFKVSLCDCGFTNSKVIFSVVTTRDCHANSCIQIYFLWLPVAQHIHFHIMVHTYKSLNSTAPDYLCSLLSTRTMSFSLHPFHGKSLVVHKT